MKTRILQLFFLMLSAGCFAQLDHWTNYTNAVYATGFAEDQTWVWISTPGGLAKVNKASGHKIFYTRGNSGLPSNDLTCVTVDVSGVVWVGSSNSGVTSFDGVNWKTYDTSNSSLHINDVSCIASDSKGHIWIGSWDGYVSCIDQAEWSWSNSPVNCLKIDKNDVQWIGINGGIVRHDSVNTHMAYAATSMAEKMSSIAIDTGGDVWFTTDNEGLLRLTGSTVMQYSIFTPFCVSIDTTGNIWVGTMGGLLKYNGTTWTTYQGGGVKDNFVRLVYTDRNNNVWLSYVFNREITELNHGTFIAHDVSNCGLAGNIVFDIATDAEGNHWFATGEQLCSVQGGLVKFDGTSWTRFDTATYNLSSHYVNSVDVHKDSSIWAALYNEGVVRCKNGTFQHFTINNSGLPDNIIHTVRCDPNGDVWIGTGQGLARFDGVNWYTYTLCANNSDANYLSIAIDKHGNKWFSTWTCGLVKYDGQNFNYYNTGNSGIADDQISALSVDSMDNVWFVAGGNLCKFDGTNWTTFPDSIIKDVSAIAFDRYNRKWIGSYYGLYMFNDTVWTKYDMQNSRLVGPNVASVKVGADDRVWVGTQNGLAVFDPRSGVLTSIPAITDGVSVKIYPNPFSSCFIVGCDQTISSIQVKNMLGEVAEIIYPNASSVNIDLKGGAGIYFVEINTNGKRYIRKIIKDQN